MFAEKGGGHLQGWWNKLVFIWKLERTFIIVLSVFTHDYDIINNILFWDMGMFEKIVLVVGCVFCYIIAHSSNSALLIKFSIVF